MIYRIVELISYSHISLQYNLFLIQTRKKGLGPKNLAVEIFFVDSF